MCFTVFGVRENREYTDAPPISFKKIWTTITGNDQLLWISLIFLLQQIGNGLIVGGIGSTYIYFDFGYEGGLFSLFSIVGMSVTAFLMIFYPAISRHIKRKKLMTVLACISMAGYAHDARRRTCPALDDAQVLDNYRSATRFRTSVSTATILS